MDERTYICTDGRLRPASLGRVCQNENYSQVWLPCTMLSLEKERGPILTALVVHKGHFVVRKD